MENDVPRAIVAPDRAETPKVKLFDGTSRPQQATHSTTKFPPPNSASVSLMLRVTEARVEDVGHAIARLAPIDLQRLGAQTGDTLKISGAATGVARAESSDDRHEGMIQIDGTCRSNCNLGLQELVTGAHLSSSCAAIFSRFWIRIAAVSRNAELRTFRAISMISRI
jgi:hypothetical protein